MTGQLNPSDRDLDALVSALDDYMHDVAADAVARNESSASETGYFTSYTVKREKAKQVAEALRALLEAER